MFSTYSVICCFDWQNHRILTDHHSFSSNFSIKYYDRGTTTAFVIVSTKNPRMRMRTMAGVPGNIVMVTVVDHIPMRVKIMTRPITRTTLKIMIGRMETSTPRMRIALKVLI